MLPTNLNSSYPYSGAQANLNRPATSDKEKKKEFPKNNNWFDKLSQSPEWKPLSAEHLEAALNCKDVNELAKFASNHNIKYMMCKNEKGETTIFNFDANPPLVVKENGFRPLVNNDIGRLQHQAFIYSVYEESFDKYSAEELEDLKFKFNQSHDWILSKFKKSQTKLEKISEDIAKIKEALNDTDEHSENKYDVNSLAILSALKMRAEQVKNAKKSLKELIEFNSKKMEQIEALHNNQIELVDH